MKKAGFGLLEVMLALGLAGVLVVVLMQLSKQQADQQKKALRDVELTEIYNQFINMYTTSGPCNATFEGTKLGDVITEFRTTSFDYTQPPFAQVGQPFQGLKVYIESMKILDNAEITALQATNPGLKITEVSQTPDSFGLANIQFRVRFNRGANVTGSKTVQKIFTIPVLMAKYIIADDITEHGVKDECINTFGGKVADDKMRTNDPDYQDLSKIEPVTCAGGNCFAHCLVVNANPAIPIQDMHILKCNTSK